MDDIPSPPTGPEAPPQPPPSRRQPWHALRRRWLAAALLALIVAAAYIGTWAYDTLPRRVDAQQVFVVGQTQFSPGREGTVRVVVRNTKNRQPIANASVSVRLVPENGVTLPRYQGRTGQDGSLAASFTIPESAATTATLIVEATSDAGHDVVKQPVTVQRSYKLLLTTDKPVYQPGQTVHLRALALSTLDMKAVAGANIDFLVEDPKGNKVFRKTVASSPFGVAAADFTLASEVINGNYKLSVSLGDTTSEKTVNVKPYVLPKFAVKVTTERSYYLPGQRVAGSVQCDYFFGKPVAGGQVEILGSVFDVEQTEVVSIQGRTGDDGAYRFEFDLPAYLAGRGLESDQAELSLQVSVIDQAEHTEQTSKVLPIAADPILIEVVPEAGVLKPGLENRLYILTSYPDGLPARTRLSLALGGREVRLETGAYGLAEHAFVPETGATHLAVTADDAQGQSARKEMDLAYDAGSGVVLLRADRATYRVGDTMQLVALTSQSSGSLFLDVVKDGQTLSTRSQPVRSGRAEFAVDLSGDLFGALTLHAYKVLADGSIIRDTRVVVVAAPRDVATDIRADREVYRPGETARLTFNTRTSAGPVASALGVAIVDESVFAVMEQDPGFAKLYFLLQKELLEPRYQIKGFTLPEVLTTTVDTQLAAVQDRAARAAWAPLPAGALSLSLNSLPLKIQAAQLGRQMGLNRVSDLTLIALMLVPLALWITVILGLHHSGILGRALGRFGLLTVGLVFVGPFACVGFVVCLAMLQSFLPHRAQEPAVVLLLLGFLAGWLVAVAALAVYAWARRDWRAQMVWLLLAAWVALGVALALASTRGAVPHGWLGAGALLAYLAGLLALLLFGVGLYLEGHRQAGAFTFAVVLLFIPAVIAGAALPQLVRYMGPLATLGDPTVYAGPLGWLSGCAAAPGRGGQFDLRSLGMQGLTGKSSVRGGMPIAPSAEKAAEEQPPETPARQEAPRLRQYFPETLLWLPELETDPQGLAALDVPLADSITTWRVTALASTQNGELGFSNAALRVFQDFFVDLDLPVALTQNDEVAIPVAIYNYMPEAQTVRLEVAPDEWFELQDAAEKTIEIGPNDIDVVYFRIRVTSFGERGFQVTAYGSRLSDAIRRPVTVVPDGRLVRRSESDWLRDGRTVTATIPVEALAGTQRLEVKIYPGVVAQVVEGLEKILRLPFG